MVEDEVEIPRTIMERCEYLTLCLDVMHINDIPMLACIDKSIRYRSLVPLANMTAPELYRAIDVITRLYNGADFRVKYINCDRQFKTLFDAVKDNMGIKMNYAATGEHVPEAECNIRTIKERVRCTYHYSPFKYWALIMVRYAAMTCTMQLKQGWGL